MRAIFGLLLVLLGLAMAVLWMPEHNGEQQLAVVTNIATKGIAPVRDRTTFETQTTRTFSPQTPLLATSEPTQRELRSMQHTAGVARIVTPQSSYEASGAAAVVMRTSPSGQAFVTSGGPGSSNVAGRAPEAVTSSPLFAAPEMRRDELVRNIQRELKRVGCYNGDVDGDWGNGSRRAMSNFTDRVNASLPIDQPDFILLTLVRGHAGTACGRGCPVGQSMSDAGRCIPAAVMATAPLRTVDPRTATRDMARDTSRAATPTAPSRTAAAGGWTTSVQREPITAVPMPTSPIETRAAQAGPLPSATSAMAASAPLGTTTAAAVTPASPLPGRMAIGGPSAASTYLMPAPLTGPSRDAATLAAEAEQAAGSAANPGSRSRAKRSARRNSAAGPYAYRYPVPSIGIYAPVRISAPRYYASAAPRRGRSWTGSFFGGNP